MMTRVHDRTHPDPRSEARFVMATEGAQGRYEKSSQAGLLLSSRLSAWRLAPATSGGFRG